jgi:HAD superfamily hydrolase (TIGR01490 family)
MALIIFDLDGTIIHGQSQEYLIKYLLKKKEVSPPSYLLMIIWFLGYKIGVCRDPSWIVKYGVKKIVKNRNTSEVNKIIQDFYWDVLIHKINPEMIKKIQEHRQKNDKLILLTNCIEPLAIFIAKKLGIDTVFATELEIAGDTYTGKISGNIVYGDQKRVILLENYSESELSKSLVYADHYSDFSIFSIVKLAYLVNPSNKTKRLLKNYQGKTNIKLLMQA